MSDDFKIEELVVFSELMINTLKSDNKYEYEFPNLHCLIGKPLTITESNKAFTIGEYAYKIKEDSGYFSYRREHFNPYEEKFELGEELFLI